MLVRDRILDELMRAGEDSRLEVHQGRLREKPEMSFDHNDVMVYLAHQLISQLDRSLYRVHVDNGRVRRTDATYYLPDLIVIPVHLAEPFRGRSDLLEIYDDPLPLVAEIWSKSTGDYDVDVKLPEYMERGDREILRLHPFDGTLTAWRRQPNGEYTNTVSYGGKVELASLPGVVIDLDELFAFVRR
jgi:Uma2 family endonuclease